MNKLVSVIIPTYKRSDFLLQTIDSVLKQTYSPIEIIVVDDNGMGSEYQIVTQLRLKKLIDNKSITYITHENNRNGSAARNTGFRASKGEYINFLDDDDELMPKKIEMQVKALENKDNSYGATYCNRKTIRLRGITKERLEVDTQCMQDGDVLEEYLMAECLMGTSAILFKRCVVESLGGWDESYYRHQDLELMTRFFQHYKICPTDTMPLIVYNLMKDRSNVPNPERNYNIKKKYFNQFTSYFDKRNITKNVKHHFWLECCLDAIRARDYKIFKLAKNEIEKDDSFNFHDWIKITRQFVIGIVENIKK